MQKPLKKKLTMFLGSIALIGVIFAAGYFMGKKDRVVFEREGTQVEEPLPEIITESKLKNIIPINTMTVYTVVYNGVAEVSNEENPEEMNYYVAYSATLDLKIDFDKVDLELDQGSKTISVTIPEAYWEKPNVDPASLDYMYANKKARKTATLPESIKACEEDVELESGQQEQIYESAQENAENVIRSLLDPFVEQLDSEYTLVIIQGGE